MRQLWRSIILACSIVISIKYYYYIVKYRNLVFPFKLNPDGFIGLSRTDNWSNACILRFILRSRGDLDDINYIYIYHIGLNMTDES